MTWLSANWPQVVSLTIDHLLLSLPAILVSILVAVPIGRLAWRRPRLGRPVLVAAMLMYAIPALPLLIVIPAIFNVPLRSEATMIIALSIYGTALLASTAADAFTSVDSRVREAAIAIGHSRMGMFWRVDLPLAFPVLLSGIRVMTVSTISLVTIGALIGVPGLGMLLTDGFQRGIGAEVATGIIATVALALIADGLLLLLGRAVTPWSRARHRPVATRKLEVTA
ncbi:ABC transporter permease [Gulosibacter molinativorax]|uniref:ABC transporter permease n=1 Tax=Gulosibacter molinativorax TaxID=256821 RepID=A0ABT7C5A2_9MICO|nr:ABC transporter permease subunit [Gulosibacter molinativorax]MDJ1370329.1 ABC transporter permease [Gulosibacter molinativorax]QUY61241.1 ABC-type proline/glycine betaine transport system, permease component [Gulosibacter molinativorax]